MRAPTQRPTPRTVPTATRTSLPGRWSAKRTLQRLTLSQQVGQLLMAGVPAAGASAGLLHQLHAMHVGNVILTGRSSQGARLTASVVRSVQSALTGRATAGVPLLVATDQEGGAVQVLNGPGFSDIPSAREQGTWPAARLRSRARLWASQLQAAGVNLDLAPVGDVVPDTPDPRTNGPIGFYDRQLGSTPRRVRTHATAFVRGMSAVGVGTAVKHFPGLGHVRGNTDTARSVVDDVTGPHDPGLSVFPDAAHAGLAMVMTSTAVYAKIDPARPASFSPAVIDGLLRERLGFHGVVVSDDLGAASQVQQWTPGQRVSMFVSAGGDLALTVRPSDVTAMVDALVGEARRDVTMRRRIKQAASRVLVFKQRLGLLAG